MGFSPVIQPVDLSTVTTPLSLVKAKTDNLPAAPADEAGKIATVEADVAGLGTYVRIKSAAATGQSSFYTAADPLGGLLTAGTNAYGAWLEMTASAVWDMYIGALYFSSPSSAVPFMIQIGLGAAGSESPKVATRFGVVTAAGMVIPMPLAIPLFVPQGTRVAMRAAASAGTPTCRADAQIIRASDLETF